MTKINFEDFTSIWSKSQDKHLELIKIDSCIVVIFQSNNFSKERLFRILLRGGLNFKYLKPYLLEHLIVMIEKGHQFTMSVNNPDLFETFNHLAFSIYSTINENSTELDIEKAIIDGFQKYFYLFSKKKANSLNTVVGLYGELLFLKEMINNKGSEFIKSWNGPDGNRHDFSIGDTSIEIKSCHKNYDSITIANEYQLLVNPPEKLFLNIFHFDVKENAQEDSMKILIHDIFELCETTEHKLILISKINDVGITFNENFSLERPLKIDLMGEIVYIVDDLFPKVSLHDLPDGVSHVRYLLQLSSLPTHLKMDKEEIWKQII